jgi:hypothetical protein
MALSIDAGRAGLRAAVGPNTCCGGNTQDATQV